MAADGEHYIVVLFRLSTRSGCRCLRDGSKSAFAAEVSHALAKGFFGERIRKFIISERSGIGKSTYKTGNSISIAGRCAGAIVLEVLDYRG